jgi:hypothetical protein
MEEISMEKSCIIFEHFKELIEMVWRLGSLEKNWDYCGALPIEKSALTKAVRLLYTLKDNNLLGYHENGPSYVIPDQEFVELTFDSIKKNEGAKDSWSDIDLLKPYIDYKYFSIWPTPIGGVVLSCGCHISFMYVTILPEIISPVSYECGYIDESKSPPIYCLTEKGKTNDYEKIAFILRDNVYHCV